MLNKTGDRSRTAEPQDVPVAGMPKVTFPSREAGDVVVRHNLDAYTHAAGQAADRLGEADRLRQEINALEVRLTEMKRQESEAATAGQQWTEVRDSYAAVLAAAGAPVPPPPPMTGEILRIGQPPYADGARSGDTAVLDEPVRVS